MLGELGTMRFAEILESEETKALLFKTPQPRTHPSAGPGTQAFIPSKDFPHTKTSNSLADCSGVVVALHSFRHKEAE